MLKKKVLHEAPSQRNKRIMKKNIKATDIMKPSPPLQPGMIYSEKLGNFREIII